MTDRPILFSAPMVRALLGGRKTQTRRKLQYQPTMGQAPIRKLIRPIDAPPFYEWRWKSKFGANLGPLDIRIKSGDRLYVREHWRTTQAYDDLSPSEMGGEEPVRYLADNTLQTWGFQIAHFQAGRYRQAMHMPRWASRLTLTVTDVRVERLQAISEADAIAEGIEDVTRDVAPSDKSLRFWKRYKDGGWNGYVDTAVGSYASLWTEINGPGAWETNPWVAAYTFTVTPKNIDEA